MFCIKLTIVSCVIAKWCLLLMKFRTIEFLDTYTHTHTYACHDVSLMKATQQTLVLHCFSRVNVTLEELSKILLRAERLQIILELQFP